MKIELILKNETRIMYKVSYTPKINSFPYKVVDVCKYPEEEVIQKNMSYGNEIKAQEWGYQNIRSEEKLRKVKELLKVLIEKNDEIVLNYGELVERQAGTLLNRLEQIMEAI